jgi:hypothetical protein
LDQPFARSIALLRAVALLVLFATATWTRIIAANLGVLANERLARQEHVGIKLGVIMVMVAVGTMNVLGR